MLAIRAARLFDGNRTTRNAIVYVDAGTVAGVAHGEPAGVEVLDLGRLWGREMVGHGGTPSQRRELPTLPANR
ncbi:hypothetical protein AB0H87_32280, partial [Asanoa sp. NPDC050611]